MNKKDHHNKALDNPELKKLPFQVEEDYFKGLSGRIMNAIDAEESDLKYNLHLKKSPFTVPENYFSELSDQIESKLVLEKKKVRFFERPFVRWMSVAASLALLMTIYFNQPSQTSTDILSSVSDETIISFLESENTFADDLFMNVDEIDSVLDAIYADEASSFVNTLIANPELEYDFEYFDY